MSEKKYSPIDDSYQYHVLHDKYMKAIEALKEIEQGKGSYSRNQHTFANNTIAAMKEVAKKCLDDLWIEREVEQDA